MAVPEGDSGAIAAPAVGARVLLFGKHLATVRYVGAVDGQAGQWVGIEYDDPSAGGKHDGSHAGRRYFSTSQPTAGSLVKLPKFLEAADLGRSLVAAARERYGGGNGDSGTDGGDDNGQAVSSTQQQGRKLRQQLYLPSSSGSRKIAVEVVAPAAGLAAAARRQSAGDSGVAAALVAHGISSVGDAEALRKALPSLTELDLSDNLIPSWSFVAELAHALPELRTLNLSGNRLALPGMPGGPAAWELPQAESGSGHSGAMGRVPASLAPPSVASLAGLRCLVLNSCRVSWPQAVALGQQLPNLQELHLCSNGIASLALPAEGLQGAAQGPAGEQAAATAGSEQAAAAAGSKQQAAGSGQAAATAGSGQTEGAAGSEQAGGAAGSGQAADTRPDGPTGALLAAAFPRLHLLDLDDNELSSWADLAPLGALPTLRTLALSGTRLAAVAYTGGFPVLRSLLLGGCRLGGWASVDQLDRFPALEEARLSDNPLTAAAPAATRYQCIARVSRLTALNASVVGAAERWDAEVNYLRQVTDELAGAGADEAARAAVLAANPRFPALVQKYGELAPAASNAAAGSALASSTAQLTICHGGKQVQKRLPVSLTVGKLKLVLERLLRVKAAQQALLLVPPADSGAQPEDITDDESKELRYYDACDGCRLEVGTSDPAARAAALAAAKAAAAAAHAARMEQHEKQIQQFRAVEQRLMA